MKKLLFLSTLSLRRATNSRTYHIKRHENFYPRSPCGERQAIRVKNHEYARISIHALLAESDCPAFNGPLMLREFLSTLSLRRATIHHRKHRQLPYHFYPRSPCGERLGSMYFNPPRLIISIHALLAESDVLVSLFCVVFSISIHALLAESDMLYNTSGLMKCISIHALLAESDGHPADGG